MFKLKPRQIKILLTLLEKENLASSAIHKELLNQKDQVSLVTVKRNLSDLVNLGLSVISNAGRSTTYSISLLGRIFSQVDEHQYCAVDVDNRFGLDRFNHQLLTDLPKDFFSDEELKTLNQSTSEYLKRTKNIPPTIQKKELERLIIELSWKSSRIEGNTYTLLDTEKLILEGVESPKYSRDETKMILNHKDAFNFVHQNSSAYKNLTQANLEKLHQILVKDLNVGLGLRKSAVGIVGSRYLPLDNIYQIEDALNQLIEAVNIIDNPFAKALITLLGISYIQPFEDGNKRTSRLTANAILLAYGCSPLSYRSLNEEQYREAVLVFYELNSIEPFKKIFINQYQFAAKNYTLK